MDSDIGKQLIIIFSLIVANGLFSMTEMAIISARKSRLESMADLGIKGAKTALKLAEEPNQMLSTVQIGITLIGIITGLYGGAALSKPLENLLNLHFPEFANYSETISVFVIVSFITYLSLVIGELVPKRLALNSPETIATFVSRPMNFFSLVCKPLVVFFSLSTEIILKVLGIKNKEVVPITEDEIKMMITQGAEMGAFEKEEPELVDNIFHLADLNASDVMTPRLQLQWIDIDESEEKIKEAITTAHHSKLLIGKDSLDEMMGLITISDLFSLQLKTVAELPFKELIQQCVRKPVIVPESVTLMKLLSIFRSEGAHEAVVLDEYGSLSGLVTLHDIMEEIVGLMPSGEEEKQEEENRVIQRTANTWLVDGLLNIDEFKEYFSIESLFPGEEEDLYKTVGGLTTYLLGHIPTETESVTLGNYMFEVIDMDNARVDKILVTYIEPPETAE